MIDNEQRYRDSWDNWFTLIQIEKMIGWDLLGNQLVALKEKFSDQTNLLWECMNQEQQLRCFGGDKGNFFQINLCLREEEINATIG